MLENGMKVNGRNEILTIKGRVRFILENVKTGEIEITEWKDNLITTAGKQMILNRLGNLAVKTNEGMLTYGALGTGTLSPAVSDVILGTEVARRTVSLATVTGSILTIRVFFPTGDANTTLTEFGWFGEDATGVSGTGTLFNRILISKTKTSDKTLTVEQDIELI